MSGVSRTDQLHDKVDKLNKSVDNVTNLVDNLLMIIQSQTVVIKDLLDQVQDLHDDMINRRQSMEEFARQAAELEAKQGHKCSEDQIRSIVGAPSIEEESLCMCGEAIDSCPDAYEHMTQGC